MTTANRRGIEACCSRVSDKTLSTMREKSVKRIQEADTVEELEHAKQTLALVDAEINSRREVERGWEEARTMTAEEFAREAISRLCDRCHDGDVVYREQEDINCLCADVCGYEVRFAECGEWRIVVNPQSRFPGRAKSPRYTTEVIRGLQAGKTLWIDRKDSPVLPIVMALESEGLVTTELLDYKEEQYSVLKVRWKREDTP